MPTLPHQTESAIVRACLDYLAARQILAWRNNTTGLYDPARKRFREFNSLRGVSDILGVLPGGRLLAVECKSRKGKLTFDQHWFMDCLYQLGAVGIVARSVADLEEGLRKAGIPCQARDRK